MSLKHGVQTVDIMADKKIIKSGAVGATNVEEVRWLIDTLMTSSAEWKDSGWAYLIDITQMSPAAPEVSNELVSLHKKLEEANCKAMAFVEGSQVLMRVQAKLHQQQSHAHVQEGHFATEEEAIEWIKTILG